MVKLDKQFTSYFNEPSIGAWEDEKFTVIAFKDEGVIRLDFHRKDWKDGITWDEIQDIKDSCGFEDFDAIEFYPAKKDILNNANFRHIYIFKDKLPLIRRK
jgi:hypothetical protein